MITRRTALAYLASAVAVAALPQFAFAAERVAFDRAAFDAALKSGKPVLIDVSASWCPTCHAQARVVNGLTATPKYADYTIFEVNYDTEKDIMRSFGAQQRSTLIAFKNGKEVGRIVGDTRAASIEALLGKAI
jgi:thioredoxin-like negative regulator of GroEL